MQFLAGSDVVAHVRQLLEKPEPARLAVAFWGSGAISSLGLDSRHLRGRKTRIICDLTSGVCNPKEIERLLALQEKGLEIRAMKGLHAKVYATGEHVVIGSANASTNGLGRDGDDLRTRHEACAAISDPAFAAEVERWFDNRWTEALTIDDRLLKFSRRLWKDQKHVQEDRDDDPSTLLGRLRTDHQWFSGKQIRLLVYRQSATYLPTGSNGIRKMDKETWSSV